MPPHRRQEDGKTVWQCGARVFDLSGPTLVMGILNVTPDSFSDGGLWTDPDQAVAWALEMERQGADIIDIGGESTRPGARPVDGEEETARVAPIIAALRRQSEIAISIDTTKATVARRALEAGADIINDVSGLRGDPAMLDLAAATQAGLVVMHSQGAPADMQRNPRYDDVVAEIRTFFQERLATLGRAGIDSARIVFDPGIGFGKTVEHNLRLVARLGDLQTGAGPQLLGVSRKSFIGKTLNLETGDRLEGTLAAVAVGVWNGAVCVRVHDVAPARRVVDMVRAIRGYAGAASNIEGGVE